MKNYKNILNYIEKYSSTEDNSTIKYNYRIVSAQAKKTPAKDAPAPRPKPPATVEDAPAPRPKPPATGEDAPPPRVKKPATQYYSTVKTPTSVFIKEMQQAMIALANENFDYKSGKAISKDFHDFMIESYSYGSTVKGHEWDPKVRYHTLGTTGPSDLIELSIVFDQIKKINSINNPIKPDGRWQFRTQNAIKNIYAFADALVRVYDDFNPNIRNPDFTKQDLDQLSTQIPQTTTEAKTDEELKKYTDLDTRAGVITVLVNKLTKFYKSFKDNILDKLDYKQYVNKDINDNYKTFDIKMKPDVVDDGSIPSNLENRNIYLPDSKLTINLNELSSQRNFRDLLIKKFKYSPEDAANPEIQEEILKKISEQIQKKIT